MNFTFVFHAPQIIWLCLVGIGIVSAITMHGKESKSHTGTITILISLGLGILLQIWGGAYRSWGMPQIILIAVAAVGFLSSGITSKTYTVNAFSVVSSFITSFGILYWAGFFAGLA